MQSESFLPLKSPKRFFSFSGSHPSPSPSKSPSSPHPVSWSSPTSPPICPVPPLPPSSKSHPFASSHSLGSGATVVRTPADALQGSMARQYDALGLTYKNVPVKKPTISATGDRTTSSLIFSAAASEEASTGYFQAPVVTPVRPMRPIRDLENSEPFKALLLSRIVRPLPPQPLATESTEDEVVVNLELAYSTNAGLHDSEPPRVMLPLHILRQKAAGSKLLAYIDVCLGMHDEVNELLDSRPDLTDGESAYSDESLKEDRLSADIDSLVDHYADLDALISNEETFNQSMELSPPSHHKPLPDLPCDPPRSIKKRALFRNQQNLFPSPSSAFFTKFPDRETPKPLILPSDQLKPQLRLSAAPLRVPPPLAIPTRKPRTRRTLTEIRILLLRPAEPYHAIAAYMTCGSFPIAQREGDSLASGAVSAAYRYRQLSVIATEANWLGMADINQAAHEVMQHIALAGKQKQGGKIDRNQHGKVTAGWI